MTEPLLDIQDAKVYYPVRRGAIFRGPAGFVKAVDGVSLQVKQGEVLGLVGESGCGKSTLARSVVRLAPLTAGRIKFEGTDLSVLDESGWRGVRPRLQMIFQDPYASLNPRRTVFDTLAEPLLTHRIVPRSEVSREVTNLMELVGLARRFVRKYPHEFSGGQRQRIAIARALALRPKLILADEPVSALDVSVQSQILNLLQDLCKERDLTLMLIAHDLSVVRHMAQRIAVMYLGKIMELGDAHEVFERPLHPYTKALLSAIPYPDPDAELTRTRLPLRGEPPSPLHPPAGCPFHTRCPWAGAQCAEGVPPFESRGTSQEAACVRLDYVREVAAPWEVGVG